jgi:hypothetical protein
MNIKLIGLAAPKKAEAARFPERPRYSFNTWLMSYRQYTLIAYACKQFYRLLLQRLKRSTPLAQ